MIETIINTFFIKKTKKTEAKCITLIRKNLIVAKEETPDESKRRERTPRVYVTSLSEYFKDNKGLNVKERISVR